MGHKFKCGDQITVRSSYSKPERRGVVMKTGVRGDPDMCYVILYDAPLKTNQYGRVTSVYDISAHRLRPYPDTVDKSKVVRDWGFPSNQPVFNHEYGKLDEAREQLRQQADIEKADRNVHYQNMGIDILTFCKANLSPEGYEGALMKDITKYVWRRKNNRLEDLQKANDYLKLLIQFEKEKSTI